MKMRIGFMLLLMLSPSVSADGGDTVQVVGHVVDAQGKPVAGARVAEHWFAKQTGSLEPLRPTRSEADGWFSLEMELHTHDRVVMAIDATGSRGGVATVSAKKPGDAIRIVLAPLAEIRGRYASEKPGQSLAQTFVSMLHSADKLRLARGPRRSR